MAEGLICISDMSFNTIKHSFSSRIPGVPDFNPLREQEMAAEGL
jgi:hypothetical protein